MMHGRKNIKKNVGVSYILQLVQRFGNKLAYISKTFVTT